MLLTSLILMSHSATVARAAACEAWIAITAEGRPDAREWADRIIAGISLPGFRFVNRTEGTPRVECGVDYNIMVNFSEIGLVNLKIINDSGIVLAAENPASDQEVVDWIRKAATEKASPIRFPRRAEGPPIVVEAGGCACVYYSVDTEKTLLAVRSGYGWLMARASCEFGFPWRRYDDAPTFDFGDRPLRSNGEPNAIPYYAPPFTGGLEDSVQFIAHCRNARDMELRLPPVRVTIVPPKMVQVVREETAVAGELSMVSEVDPEGVVTRVRAWKIDLQAEKCRHVYQCPPVGKKRVVWASIKVTDSCSGSCTSITMVGKTRSGRGKTNVWQAPTTTRWPAEPMLIEAISADLYQVESVEITSYEGFYRDLILGWATWDCPESAKSYLPADDAPWSGPAPAPAPTLFPGTPFPRQGGLSDGGGGPDPIGRGGFSHPGVGFSGEEGTRGETPRRGGKTSSGE